MIQIVFLILGCTAILSCGLYHVLCSEYELPSGRADRAMQNAARQDGNERKSSIDDIFK